jgi:hypothetical protein
VVGHVAAAVVGVGMQEWCVQWVRGVVCGAHDLEGGGGGVALLRSQVFNHDASFMLCCVVCMCMWVLRGFENAKVGFKVGFRVLLDCEVEFTKGYCRLDLSWYSLSIEQE